MHAPLQTSSTRQSSTVTTCNDHSSLKWAHSESGNTLYYHCNRKYDIAGLTDALGNVVELYAYSPYGTQTVMDASGTDIGISAQNNPYGFTGRRLDEETGLWYFRARYFDSELGRFISRDPLGFVDGLSLYAGYFAVGMWADPSGLLFVVPGVGGDPQTPREVFDQYLQWSIGFLSVEGWPDGPFHDIDFECEVFDPEIVSQSLELLDERISGSTRGSGFGYGAWRLPDNRIHYRGHYHFAFGLSQRWKMKWTVRGRVNAEEMMDFEESYECIKRCIEKYEKTINYEQIYTYTLPGMRRTGRINIILDAGADLWEALGVAAHHDYFMRHRFRR